MTENKNIQKQAGELPIQEPLVEREYDVLFRIFLIGKGVFGFLEFVIGLFLVFVSSASINLILVSLTRGELIDDPDDFLANHILHLSNHFTHHNQVIAGIYLTVYGLVKLVLIFELLQNRIRMYPYAIGLFLIGILYQIYQLFRHFSPTVFGLMIFECLTLLLIWHHYRKLKNAIVSR